MNVDKQRKKLFELFQKANEEITRKGAQKIIKKAHKVYKKLQKIDD